MYPFSKSALLLQIHLPLHSFNHLCCNGSQSTVIRTEIELIVPILLFWGFYNADTDHLFLWCLLQLWRVILDLTKLEHCGLVKSTNWLMITSKLAPSGVYQTQRLTWVERLAAQMFDKVFTDKKTKPPNKQEYTKCSYLLIYFSMI